VSVCGCVCVRVYVCVISIVRTRNGGCYHAGTIQLVGHNSSRLKCVAVRCSALQCVAACCSALQCVAVCCSVLQCVVSTL